jgi:DNA-binding transcriptional LysR family regulator
MPSQLRVTLRQLEYFVAAAGSGTMTAAARQCHVSQSAVSLAIADLERALGVQLVLRHKARGLTVTSAGRQVLADARRMLDQAGELESTVRHLGLDLSGRLTVACYLTLAPFLLPRILDEFGAAHAGVELDFVEGSHLEVQRRLLDGGSEVALLFDLDMLPGIERLTLYETSPHVLLAAAHPLASRPTVRLADLVAEPAVVLDVPESIQYLNDAFSRTRAAPQIRHRTISFEMVRSLVGRNLGYSLLFQRPVVEVSYEGRPVVTRPISDQLDPMSVVLARPQDARPTRRAEAFTAYCQQALASP